MFWRQSADENRYTLTIQVVQTLKTLERQTFPNGAEVEVRDMDYNMLSFEEQIMNDLETDVMVSPGRAHKLIARAAVIQRWFHAPCNVDTELHVSGAFPLLRFTLIIPVDSRHHRAATPQTADTLIGSLGISGNQIMCTLQTRLHASDLRCLSAKLGCHPRARNGNSLLCLYLFERNELTS